MLKTIAFDIDSVLFPVNELAVLPALSEHFGRTVSEDEITDFDYRKCWPNEPQAVANAAQRVAFEQFRRPDLYDGYKISDTQRDTLDVLRAAGYRVLAVSSPFREHASSKWAYCQRADFYHKDIVLCGDKSLVRFDLLIDDRPDTIRMIGPERSLVFDQPWNTRLPTRFGRVMGWELMLPSILRHIEINN